jgi:hypothetical protein
VALLAASQEERARSLGQFPVERADVERTARRLRPDGNASIEEPLALPVPPEDSSESKSGQSE